LASRYRAAGGERIAKSNVGWRKWSFRGLTGRTKGMNRERGECENRTKNQAGSQQELRFCEYFHRSPFLWELGLLIRRALVGLISTDYCYYCSYVGAKAKTLKNKLIITKIKALQ
jgi:hypothetical protein